MPWGVAAAIGGAVIAGSASKKAANTQAGAADRATEEQARQFDIIQQNEAPYREIGANALGKLTELLNSGGLTSRFAGDASKEPGYQFGLSEGQRAIDNSASARGGIGGAALKAGTRYATDYATTKYNDAFNRWKTENDTIYNRLAGISGIGQTATQNVNRAGEIFGEQAGNNIIGAGNASAASQVARGNIYGNAFNELGAWGQRKFGGIGTKMSPQPYTTVDDWSGQGYY